VRQLIGTGTKHEKFPSTSTAKTTTCDIEIITTESDRFEVVVSFLPKDLIRQYVEECVIAAAISFLEKERSELTCRRFLEHEEQRFRLSYLLGTPSSEIDEEEQEEAEEEFDRDEAVTAEDRARFAEAIRGYLSRIQSVADTASKKLEGSLNFSLETANQDDATLSKNSWRTTFGMKMGSTGWWTTSWTISNPGSIDLIRESGS